MRNALLDIAQGASNAAAGAVSGPVDLLAWAARKAGVPVGSAPVGGSAWMAAKGLTKQPQNALLGMAGETAGMISPIVAQAKAAEVAKLLLQGGSNMSAAKRIPFSSQRGAILWHGSNDSRPIEKIKPGGVFGGLFASPSKEAAESHGNALYRMTIPDEKIMPVSADLPWDQAKAFVASRTREKKYLDDLAEMALDGRMDVWDSAIPENKLLEIFGADDLGEASWALQNLRGQVAQKFGYKAAAMPDEHGLSYLVLPGSTPRPYNQQAVDLYRKMLADKAKNQGGR
jgi:phage-related tail fiber protein